ncbi:hypothetical protein PLAN_10068 [Planktothrix rubescens CCAP 1459/22]|uniref:Uncharacterized protein n=1 Tax=Planktothrix rubescens CCAP 1459/22 TaxID=329571 RepID=A0A6J7ZEU3_PLARU|nr:hypothetical protein PLAN_10068 [Planktothrix rubescens NIVA-CYA 18]
MINNLSRSQFVTNLAKKMTTNSDIITVIIKLTEIVISPTLMGWVKIVYRNCIIF